MRSEADDHVLSDAPKPREFSAVEVGRIQQRCKYQRSRKSANHRAVLGRNGIEVVNRPQTSGSGHILGNDSGITRQVLAHESADQSAVEVITTAHAEPDDHRDRMSLVEIFRGGLCGGRAGAQQNSYRNQSYDAHSALLTRRWPEACHIAIQSYASYVFPSRQRRKRGEAWALNARASQPVECATQREQPGQRCFLRSGRNPQMSPREWHG